MAVFKGGGIFSKDTFVVFRCSVLLLAANYQCGTEAILMWTAPPPAWNQTTTGTSLADIQTSVYQVRNGSTNVLLRWNYTLLPGQTLLLTTFSIGDGISQDDIGLVIGGPTGTPNNKYKDLYSIYSTSQFSNLTINKVTEQENATFQCKLLVGGDVWAYNIQVEVTDPAVITHISGNQTVNETDVVALICLAEGMPTPIPGWTRVSDNSSVFFPLTITGKQDEGGYRCTADNGIGNPASQVVYIIVESYHPINTNLKSALINNAAVVNESFNITCSSEANPPAKYRFYKNQDNFVNDTFGSDVSVITTSVSEKKKQVDYSCTPFNDFGDGLTDGLTLTVLYAPTIINISSNNTVNESDSVTLACPADGNPTPNITWTRVSDNRPVSFPLTITGKQDEGGYRCTADNGVGNPDSDVTFINVQYYHPINTNLRTSLSDKSVVVRTFFDVTCSSQANPPAKYRFYKDQDNFVNDTTGSDVSVITTSLNERVKQVNYRCTPFNDFGDGRTEVISITVLYAPDATTLKTVPSNTTLPRNSIMSLNCETNASPVAEYHFYFNGKSIGNTTSGVFNVTVEADGVYTCVPVNTVGTGDNVTVDVTAVAAKSIQTTVTTLPKPTTKVSTQVVESTISATATIDKSCDERLDVEKRFPSLACERVRHLGCFSAQAVASRCGSVIVDFEMEFNQSAVVSEVLNVLKTTATEDNFDEFKVDPNSIEQVSPPPTDTSAAEECKFLCNDVIWASVVGVLFFMIIGLILYIVWLHKKGAAGKQRHYKEERDAYDNEMALDDLQPSSHIPSKTTQSRPEYMDITEATTDSEETQRVGQSADYAPLHPSTRSWEVEKQRVTIEKVIGKGAFGQVAKGTATGLRGRPGKTTVAVKMLKYNSPESDRRDLLRELDTMKQLKPHPHVIKLLGCVTETEPLMVIIEYVPYGDLLGYLRKSRGLNDTYYKDPDIQPQTSLTSQQLVKFASEIADGMNYLSSKSIIHRDLAARNVLVGERETCKVTDFGMARDVQQDNIYEKKTKGRLPVKWTAYEALLYGTYTNKSDIWSYGVVLYEIFTIGGSPYPRVNGKRIASLLQEGYRMPKPQHVDDKLYEIMLKCWQNDPDVRPTFSELKNQLKEMENQHKRLINLKMYDHRQLYANVEDLGE